MGLLKEKTGRGLAHFVNERNNERNRERGAEVREDEICQMLSGFRLFLVFP
jgi:hypothetical protein